MEENQKRTSKKFKIFLLIFILVGFIFIKEENQQNFVDFFNSFNKKNEKTIIFNKNYEFEQEEEYLFFNNSIIKLDDSSISFLDLKDNIIWNKDLSFELTDILALEKNLYLLDKNDGDILILDNKGNTINKINIDTKIFNILEADDNILIHCKDENLERLKILDKDSKVLIEKEEKNILSYSINNKNNDYIISTLNIDEGLRSYVNIYSIATDEVKTFEYNNEIVVFTQFVNNKILISTDKNLYLLDNKELKWSKEYPLIKDILINKEKIYLLYGDNLEIIDLNGETEKKIIFGIEYEKIKKMQNYICIYGKRDILLFNNGVEILKFKTDNEILDIKGNNKIMAIHYLEDLEVYDMINANEEVKQ